MQAYLDNAATTKPSEAVIDEIARALKTDYGNPSSKHIMGVNAERIRENARAKIADTLKVKPSEIIFTSGGTEGSNLVIRSAAYQNERRGKHIITTEIEHPATAEPIKRLEDEGFEVTRLSVNEKGLISIDELRDALRDDTVLVAIMHVNNEIGTIEPIEAVARTVHAKSKDIVFFSDVIQSYGKLPIMPKRMGIDALSVSAHKIHGPKGAGFVYVGGNLRLDPIILGGGQEYGVRSGTENIPGIAGMGVACENACKGQGEAMQDLIRMRHRLCDDLVNIDGVSILGESDKDFLPSIISVTVEDVKSEVLLHALEEWEVYISAGSACSSHHKETSATLKAIGYDDKKADCTVRLSLSANTREDEIRHALMALKDVIPKLQRYKAR